LESGIAVGPLLFCFGFVFVFVFVKKNKAQREDSLYSKKKQEKTKLAQDKTTRRHNKHKTRQ
jgi:hypothetical protein